MSKQLVVKEIWTDDSKIAEKFHLLLRDKSSGEEFSINTFEDLKKVEEAERKGAERVFLKCSNWKVIPLENAIALCKKAKLIAEVHSAAEAKTALETLEKGVHGVLLITKDESEVKKISEMVSTTDSLELATAKITSVKKVGMSARSVIDTGELMTADEGMLIGNSSSGMVLMQAEVTENPHVATRPFRVNAGALSLYVMLADGKTKYLSEVKAGDEVLIVSRAGKTRKAVVVRNKIEWRPMLLIEAKSEGGEVKTIAQDAETIRVITPKGSASVAELKSGDEIVVRSTAAEARHFGMKVDERIIEQ